MEKLHPQELEALVQELAEDSGAQESPPPEVEELLQILQSGSLYLARQDAAKQLGSMTTSHPRIVRALISAYESDPYPEVRRAAAASLRAPAHQEYLQQYPDLMEAIGRAHEQHRGLGTEKPRVDQEVQDSPWSGIFHDQRWRWAPIYALILVAATSLVFTGFGDWTLLAAGVVWLAGGVLGLVILRSKGYSIGGSALGLLDLVDDATGCLVAFLALFALVGPVVLLVALFMKPRGSAVRISKRRPKAKDAARVKSGPVREGRHGSDCPACGAWNLPDREYCDECGAGLRGAAVGSTRAPEHRATARTARRRVSRQERVSRTPARARSVSYRFGAGLGAWFVRTRRSLSKFLAPGTPAVPRAHDSQEIAD